MRDVFTMGARPIANMNALRFGAARSPQDAPPRGRRRFGHRRLRQLHGRADRRRRDQFRSALQRQHSRQCHDRRHCRRQPHLQVRGERRRQCRGLCRLEDRPRRHPRRHHGLGRVRRGLRGEAPDRAGRRPLHREAAARSVPGADGRGRHHRHPGHGRGRPHLVVRRDGRQRRRRHRARARSRADPRGRHDRLRDDALREPGAHADGAEAWLGEDRRAGVPQMGAGFLDHRLHHRHGPAGGAPSRHGRGRHSARGTRSGRAAL